eukprot:gene16994-23340_t
MLEGSIDCRDIFGSLPLNQQNINQSIDVPDVDSLLLNFQTFNDYKIYSTRAHKGVYDIVLFQALNLSRGNYVNRQGVQSSTMVGAKGIGKTTSLKTFAHICKYIVPNVCVVYISFNNILENKLLSEKSLTIIVILTLIELGVQITEPGPECISPGEYLVKFLAINQMKLLLLVDELDQLYKSKSEICLRTLHNLAYMGNQPTGTLSIIVCGSSSMMEFLITTNAGVNIRTEFPLLDMGAPNLNGTKFLTKRVYSNIPTDLTAVAVIADKPFDDSSKSWIKLVTFCAGASSRAVERLISDASGTGQILLSLLPDLALSGSNTSSNSELNLLRNEIIHQIYKKNCKIFNAILYSEDIINAIATSDWEEQFTPLKYAEVQQIWKSLIRANKVAKENGASLDENLLHLGDRGWLTIGTIENSHPQDIYPYSMFHCFKEQMKSDSMPGLGDKIMLGIRRGAVEFGNGVRNPRVIAAAGTVAALSCGCTIT